MNKLRIQLMWAGLVVVVAGILSSFSTVRLEAQRETRSVGPFTEVSLGGSAHVVLKQGSPQSVVVEASPEALARFETVVENKQLHLRHRRDNDKKGWFDNKSQEPVTVYVTAPDLTALRVGGSGKLEVEGPLKANAITLAMAGSGNLLVPQLTASSLETAVAGSGTVLIGGNCPNQEIRISGSGNVKAHNLKTETCTVRVSGSGNAHVYASKTAEASISGSGNVFVAGGGQMSSSVRGSGRIAKE
ncbi:head GIN domain-containing protein [Hymenobacter terrenus]|uniref:head GIN domain-containing protein n=1 Tax=Hymenobacter terrenus TaxID=1629124 RepID=UPI000696D6D4|nr:head GIN domain-containing protein [Hymenobacter terrenus]